jgi:hypothetical protein
MVEVTLKRKKDASDTTYTRDGPVQSTRIILVGEDKDNEVTWNLTLTKKESSTLPIEYRDVLGKHGTDEVVVTIEAGTQQAELE